MAGSEFPSTTPDVDGVRHGSLGPPEPQTEPGSGIKDAGYPADHIPPSANENFVRRRYHDLLKHLTEQGSREFNSLVTALSATLGVPVPDSFRLRTTDPADDELRTRGETLIDLQGAAGAVAIAAMATDGEQLYYAQGTTVYAVDPDTGDDGVGGGFGTFLWSYTAPRAVTALEADGRFVFLGMSTIPGDDVQSLNRSTGALIDGVSLAGAGATVVGLAANGDKLSAILEAGIQVSVVSVDGSGNLTVDAQLSIGSDQKALAIDDQFAWTGGLRDPGGDDIHRIRLSTVTETLAIVLPTVSAPTTRAMCTDGTYLYIFIDRLGLEDRPNDLVSVFCLDLLSGLISWSVDLGASNPVSCAVDQQFLYGANALDDTFVLDKGGGTLLWVIPDTVVKAADGVSIFGVDVSPFHDIRKNANGIPTLDMMAVKGTDKGRRPFFNLAIPREDTPRHRGGVIFPVFGLEKDGAENAVSTSTAATVYADPGTQHQRFTTDVLLGGTYRIEWYYVWRHSANNANNSFEARVEIDDTTQIHLHQQQPQNTVAAQQQVVSGFKDIVLSAAAHDIDLDLRAVGAGTATIEESRFSIHRVA